MAAEKRCEAAEAECRRLKAVDDRREKALRDALRLLDIANDAKSAAERGAREHKNMYRKLEAKSRLAAGAPSPTRRDARIKALEAKVASLEESLRRKSRLPGRERTVKRA